jgi:hypothetical protein
MSVVPHTLTIHSGHSTGASSGHIVIIVLVVVVQLPLFDSTKRAERYHTQTRAHTSLAVCMSVISIVLTRLGVNRRHPRSHTVTHCWLCLASTGHVLATTTRGLVMTRGWP